MNNVPESKIPEIPFVSFLYITIAGHLLFAVPAIGGIWLFELLDIKELLFIFTPIILISIPISAVIAWLIAKGSNWVNTSAAITAACSVPGRVYGILFGGLLGFRYFGTSGGIIAAILFYLLAIALALRLGRYLASKVIPETLPPKI
jgi:hypothetical protein